MQRTEQGERIRTIRRALDWSQERMARELGVTANAVARWEQGTRKPSPVAVRLIDMLWEQHRGKAGAA